MYCKPAHLDSEITVAVLGCVGMELVGGGLEAADAAWRMHLDNKTSAHVVTFRIHLMSLMQGFGCLSFDREQLKVFGGRKEIGWEDQTLSIPIPLMLDLRQIFYVFALVL